MSAAAVRTYFSGQTPRTSPLPPCGWGQLTNASLGHLATPTRCPPRTLSHRRRWRRWPNGGACHRRGADAPLPAGVRSLLCTARDLCCRSSARAGLGGPPPVLRPPPPSSPRRELTSSRCRPPGALSAWLFSRTVERERRHPPAGPFAPCPAPRAARAWRRRPSWGRRYPSWSLPSRPSLRLPPCPPHLLDFLSPKPRRGGRLPTWQRRPPW